MMTHARQHLLPQLSHDACTMFLEVCHNVAWYVVMDARFRHLQKQSLVPFASWLWIHNTARGAGRIGRVALLCGVFSVHVLTQIKLL